MTPNPTPPLQNAGDHYLSLARAAVLNHLYSQIFLTVPAVIMFTAVYAHVAKLWDRPTVLYTVFGLIVANQVARIAIAFAFRKVPDEVKGTQLRWGRLWDVTVCTTTIILSGTTVIVWPSLEVIDQQRIAILMAVLAGTGLPVVSRSRKSMWVYVSAPMATVGMLYLLSDDTTGFLICGLSLLFMLRFGDHMNAHYTKSVIESARYFFEKSRAEVAGQMTAQAALEKMRFVNAASHDLRQPLQVLSIYADLLQDKGLAEEDAQTVRNIKNATGTLVDMVTGILDHARNSSKSSEPEIRSVRVNGILEKLKHDGKILAATNDNELCVRPSSLWVRTDPLVLELIARNLLGNALRYTKKGRVTIAVRRVNKTTARLVVIDNGPGIESSKLARIKGEFQRFTKDTHGYGLGLFISEEYAKSVGTTIDVRSVPHKGSMFSVALPIDDSAAPNAALAEQRYGDPMASTPGARTILVVDDEQDVAAAIANLVERWGYRAVTATSINDAQDWLHSNKPDFIVTDWDLDGAGTGSGVIQLARALWGEVPACIISGDSGLGGPANGQEHPVLVKPVNAAKLRAMLQAAFRPKSAQKVEGVTVQDSLAGRMILVVDDDAAVRDAIAAMLSGWGYAVRVAGSEQAARSVISTARPDFIVTDWDLGEGRVGKTVIDHARRLYGDLPVCVVTGSVNGQLLGKELGVPVFTKPLDQGGLKGLLQQSLPMDKQSA
jgi:signal transduction histidine kinase/DNA-binding response OmpR family regulator